MVLFSQNKEIKIVCWLMSVLVEVKPLVSPVVGTFALRIFVQTNSFRSPNFTSTKCYKTYMLITTKHCVTDHVRYSVASLLLSMSY